VGLLKSSEKRVTAEADRLQKPNTALQATKQKIFNRHEPPSLRATDQEKAANSNRRINCAVIFAWTLYLQWTATTCQVKKRSFAAIFSTANGAISPCKIAGRGYAPTRPPPKNRTTAELRCTKSSDGSAAITHVAQPPTSPYGRTRLIPQGNKQCRRTRMPGPQVPPLS